MNPAHCIYLRSSVILSSHLCLNLPSSRFPSCLTNKTLYTFNFFCVHATRHAHIIVFDFITTRTGEGYKQCTSTYHKTDLYQCNSKLNHLTDTFLFTNNNWGWMSCERWLLSTEKYCWFKLITLSGKHWKHIVLFTKNAYIKVLYIYHRHFIHNIHSMCCSLLQW
jgi:hypothetical protein